MPTDDESLGSVSPQMSGPRTVGLPAEYTKLMSSGVSPLVYVLYTLTMDVRKWVISFALSVFHSYLRVVIVKAKSTGCSCQAHVTPTSGSLTLICSSTRMSSSCHVLPLENDRLLFRFAL